MKKTSWYSQIALFIVGFICVATSALAVPMFEVNSSGSAINAAISLCLNGQGPLDCQNYSVTGTNLSIRSLTPGYTYPNAGIKVLTSGYIIPSSTPIANGYVLFSVSDTTPTAITVTTPAPTYTVGGTVSGLTTGTVVLRLNGNETLNLYNNGVFTFSTPLTYCSFYNVSILTQPDEETCNVTNGLGTIMHSNVTNVSVVCLSPSLPHALTILPLMPNTNDILNTERFGGCNIYNMTHQYYQGHSLSG